MTTDDRFARNLSAWLVEDGAHRVPDHLAEVLVHSAATRQRPWWSSPERWLPVDMTLRPRLVDTSRLLRVAVLAAIFIALLGALLLYAGSHQTKVPPPFGVAKNGVQLAWSSGDIVQAQADGTWTPLIGGPDNDLAPIPNRAGTRMTFVRAVTEHSMYLMLANIDGTAIRQLVPNVLTDADWLEWSADGRQVAFVNTVNDRRSLTIVGVDDGTATNLDLGKLSVDNDVYWLPPDGSRLIFTAHLPAKGAPRAIYTVRPDGSDLHQLAPDDPNQASYLGLDVAPDGTTASFWNYETDPSGIGNSSHVHFLDLGTGQDQRVTFDASATGETNVHFSPDGIHVVVEHNTTEDQLEIAMRDRTGPTLLVGPTFSLDADANYGFSPDGKTVFLAFSNTKPYFFDVATGTETRGSASIESFAGYQRLAP